jgi:hypothetical protein
VPKGSLVVMWKARVSLSACHLGKVGSKVVSVRSPGSASPKPTGVVRMRDEDADLGGALDHDAFSVARSTAVAPLVELRAGKWPLLRPAGAAVFGFLVLAGVIGSRIRHSRARAPRITRRGNTP